MRKKKDSLSVRRWQNHRRLFVLFCLCAAMGKNAQGPAKKGLLSWAEIGELGEGHVWITCRRPSY